MKILWTVIFSLFCISTTHAEWAMQTLKTKPRIFVIPDFLTPAECDHMIATARPSLARSTVLDDSKPNAGALDSRRTSHGMFFPQDPQDPILRNVEQRIADLTKIPVPNGEAMQVLWYQVGAEYLPHYDYFSPTTPGGASALSRGGQRVATFIMYLNTPEAGGETIFPLAYVSVIPKKGMALLFYNCQPSGEVDPLTLHGGASVRAGEKWIATKWLHMMPFH